VVAVLHQIDVQQPHPLQLQLRDRMLEIGVVESISTVTSTRAESRGSMRMLKTRPTPTPR
jgi:hypothetical protein